MADLNRDPSPSEIAVASLLIKATWNADERLCAG